MNTRSALLTLILAVAALSAQSEVIWRYGENIDAGYGDANVITPYVLFPAAFTAPYAGCSITAVEIGLAEEATNISVYVKHDPKDDDYLYRQRVDKLSQGWHTITFDEPYQIADGEAIAIGYKATFSNANGVGYSKEPYLDGDYVYNNSKQQWSNTYGSICIRAIVEGGNLPDDMLLMTPIEANVTPEYGDERYTYYCAVRNVGANEVNEYIVKCQVGDNEPTSITRECSISPNFNDYLEVDIDLANLEYGKHDVTISIASTNGNTRTYAGYDKATSTLNWRNPQFRKKVVCEEGTGTWCGWCPKGIVGLEMMKDKYPGQFFPVSIHGTDDLEIPVTEEYTYRPILERFSGFPTCLLNRRYEGDPYDQIEQMYNLEASTESPIALDIDATWNADKSQITVDANILCGQSSNTDKWTIAAILLEDGIEGYSQTNYYAGGKNGPMGGWENKTDPTRDVVYNDLARGIFPNAEGAPLGCEKLEAGTTYSTSLTFTIPATVENKDNAHVVAVIVNGTSGFAVNAAAAKPHEGAGIANAQNAASIAMEGATLAIRCEQSCQCEIFAASGALVKRATCHPGHNTIGIPARGVYIVRLTSDSGVQTAKVTKF